MDDKNKYAVLSMEAENAAIHIHQSGGDPIRVEAGQVHHMIVSVRAGNELVGPDGRPVPTMSYEEAVAEYDRVTTEEQD